MAKIKCFTVYDSKVEAYMNPFFLRTRGEAVRAWNDVVNDPSSAFNKHPEDYTLFEVAEYDEVTGVFENHKTPISLGVAVQFHKGYADKPEGNSIRDVSVER